MSEWAAVILFAFLGFLASQLKSLTEVTARIGDHNNERLDRLIEEITALREEAQDHREGLEPLGEDS